VTTSVTHSATGSGVLRPLPHLIRLEHAVLAVYHDDDRVLDTLRCEPAVRRVA